MMAEVDLKSGEVITKEAVYYSKTEFNLESTNSNEFFFENDRKCFGVFIKISKTRK